MIWVRRVLLALVLVPFALQTLHKPFVEGTSATPWLSVFLGALLAIVTGGLVGALTGWHRIARSPNEAWPLLRPFLAIVQFFAVGITMGFAVRVANDDFHDTGLFVLLYALAYAGVLALLWFAEDVVVWNSTRRVR
jgi:uncharacterized integral membrane protein